MSAVTKSMSAVFLPAVCDHGAGIQGVDGANPPQELQERRGVLGHAVVRPGRVLVLLHFPTVRETHLKGSGERRHINFP